MREKIEIRTPFGLTKCIKCGKNKRPEHKMCIKCYNKQKSQLNKIRNS